jgi:diguanylate cyclase (GGDEF)-like protein
MAEHLKRNSWRYYLVGGSAALVIMLTSSSAVVHDLIYLALSLAVVVAIGVGVGVHRPSPQAPWLVMGLAQLLWMAADATDFILVDVQHRDLFPSVADLLYLVGHPVLLLSIYLLVRARPRTMGFAQHVDIAIVMVGLAVGYTALLAQPSAASLHGSLGAAAVVVANPVFDILLIGGLLALLAADTTRARALRLLIAACGLLVAADSLSLVANADARLLDGLWVGSYVVWGAAVLHPSLAYRVRARDTSFALSGRRLLGMMAVSLSPPLVLIFEWASGMALTVWPLVLGSMALFVLVLGRMALLVRQVSQVTGHSVELQQELEFRATHDDLTLLPNRAEMVSLIGTALKRGQEHGETVAIFFVDLDGFKSVNDNLGHHAGDQVLCRVAKRLSRLAGAGPLVARLGGDEFVVLLPRIEDRTRVRLLADQVVSHLSEPIVLDDYRTAVVGASVGIAFSSDGHETSAGALLHEADLALYRAKELGRGRAVPFSDLLQREHDARAEFELALARAIEEDELVLHYQPIRDVATGQMRGVEALLRWNRPGIGLLMPSDFLPTAETSELICDLDLWAIRTALRQLEAWSEHPDLTVWVNVAIRHIRRPRVVVDIEKVLQESSAEPHRLVLEISELALLGDDSVLRSLTRLHALGVSISVSDVGAGIGAIGELDRLPVDSVKIGRDMIKTGSPHMRAVLELIVRAAANAGVQVVGEGVEREEQLALLKDVQCQSAQGFYLGMPTTPDKLVLPAAIPALAEVGDIPVN